MFLTLCGIKPDKLRFRQHLKTEMAHYAKDCWDAEIQNSYGWVECVGIADRSCFDLTAHSKETKVPLTAYLEFPDGPQMVDFLELVTDKGAIGKEFKDKAQILLGYLNKLDNDGLEELQKSLASGPVKIKLGKDEFEVTSSVISFKKVSKKIQGKHIYPAVIEPSFGIGRILYSILEHSYFTRGNDEQRAVLSLPPLIAPVKVSVLPLMQQTQLTTFVPRIVAELTNHGISSKVDDTGSSIGKRYSRTDEIGIPFGITIDHDTIVDDTVTFRERDTTTQIRVKIDRVAQLVQELVSGRTTWTEVRKTFLNVESKNE